MLCSYCPGIFLSYLRNRLTIFQRLKTKPCLFIKLTQIKKSGTVREVKPLDSHPCYYSIFFARDFFHLSQLHYFLLSWAPYLFEHSIIWYMLRCNITCLFYEILWPHNCGIAVVIHTGKRECTWKSYYFYAIALALEDDVM